MSSLIKGGKCLDCIIRFPIKVICIGRISSASSGKCLLIYQGQLGKYLKSNHLQLKRYTLTLWPHPFFNFLVRCLMQVAAFTIRPLCSPCSIHHNNPASIRGNRLRPNLIYHKLLTNPWKEFRVHCSSQFSWVFVQHFIPPFAA